MEIKILGTGCPKCKTLYEITNKVIKETGIEANVTKVEDIVEIMKYNIMVTPAMIINDKVVAKGRIPSAEEIKKFLTDNN